MDTRDNETDVSASELEAAALMRGRKLGFLIAASTLPDEVKEEMVVLAQDMTADQQDHLLDVFEAKYLDEQTLEAEKELQAQAEVLVKKYQVEDEAQTKGLVAALSQI
jgi:hypothetical protein